MEMESGMMTIPTDTQSPDWEAHKAAIKAHAEQQTPEALRENKLFSLRLKMEDYLRSPKPERIILAGEFLREHLQVLEVKQNVFAAYLGLKPSNLSKLLKGERPINSELALILGKIFDMDAELWLKVQAKNELLRLAQEKKEHLERFSLTELMENQLASA